MVHFRGLWAHSNNAPLIELVRLIDPTAKIMLHAVTLWFKLALLLIRTQFAPLACDRKNFKQAACAMITRRINVFEHTGTIVAENSNGVENISTGKYCQIPHDRHASSGIIVNMLQQ